MTDSMTLRQLVAQAAVELSRAELEQPSGRVSEVPSPRTVRYYTTHGLLDRPAAFRGRTALYTRRHLMQLVAIKRLQADGATLNEVQDALLGCSEDELARTAKMHTSPATPRASSARQESFWRAAPARDTEPATPHDTQVVTPPVSTTTPPPSPTGAYLHAHVLLMLLAPRRALTPEDEEALRAAAAPLIKTLEARHLI